MPDLIVRKFLNRPSYSLDWVERKDTAADVAKGRARRIPVTQRMAEAFGLGGVISLFEVGKLQ